LEDAKKLRLEARARLGDLVEEDRALVGLREEAGTLTNGAGERALLVAEELGLQELAGQRGTVDRDECRMRALARGVDRARDELLTGAALARDENGRVRRRDAADESMDPLDQRMLPDQ
jgi:hypothetical protein